MTTVAQRGFGEANGRIADLIAQQTPGRPLTQTFYTDQEIFDCDIERVFMQHWLCAGHVSSVRNPGDYFLFEVASESVIIVRGADGQVRAFANVCRHRGSRVCTERAGSAKVFTCPYHGWSYGLDGKLSASRHMPADFDSSGHGLKEISLRIIEGLILITFSASPLELNLVEETLRSCYGPYDWSQAKVAFQETYLIGSNWKLAVENYLECYHCSSSHPEFARLFALEQPMPRIEKLNAKMQARTAELGINIPLRNHWVPGEREEATYCFRYALYDGVVTGSPDGKPVAPLMGQFRDYDGGATSLHIGPASFFLSYPDLGLIYRFAPKTARTCEMEVIWLVKGNAREGVDYDREKLTWLWRITNDQDKRITDINQDGVDSRFYEPGPYSPMEANVDRYVQWYLGELMQKRF